MNPITLWRYHEQHEIPHKWWAWDYTLSWLIENNHPPITDRIVLFNHLLEDEPPAEAVIDHPWMRPLLKWPMSRARVAEIIEFLARAHPRLIILDNDFPQYSENDAVLAKAISDCSTGKLTGRKVPVLMARTINRRSFGNIVQVQLPSTPSGVLNELENLEPDTDLRQKYTGITGVFLDEDQVVRRIACRLQGQDDQVHESIVLKALEALHRTAVVPDTMDIDFVGPPNSELIPIRPVSYLLDPDRKEALLHPPPESQDVKLDGAIVLLGDGVVDLFSTPTTNYGVNLMSGSEVLANAFETIAGKRWLTRVEGSGSYLYIIAVALAGALLMVAWKWLQRNTTLQEQTHIARLRRLLGDFACFALTVFLAYLSACLLFSYDRLIVPVISPTVALTFGYLAAAMWERERERQESYKQRLDAAQEKLRLQSEIHSAELETREAQAQAREMLIDKERRREFVRRINHDLRAPVSVLSWTISRLKKDGLQSKNAPEKLDRLANTSDRLFALINELVRSYDTSLEKEKIPNECDLVKVLSDSFKMQSSLAEQRGCTLSLDVPEHPVMAAGNQLELSRCIDNLIRNAMLHNEPGVHVGLSLKAHANEHVITVSDNGRGIAPEHIRHIFDSGYRINGRESTEANHEGLGLNIVKSFVEKMNGRIEVSSTYGSGAEFKITLPAIDTPGHMQPPPETTDGDRSPKEHIEPPETTDGDRSPKEHIEPPETTDEDRSPKEPIEKERPEISAIADKKAGING